MSWTQRGAENAFLAFDRNGNGQIDNGSELFGDYSPLGAGGLAENGFLALAEFDTNRDGSIDSRDADWPLLLLWTDRDHNGASSNDEIVRLASSAVAALEIAYRPIGKRDKWGNLFRYTAKFRLWDGISYRQRTYYDVYFLMEP